MYIDYRRMSMKNNREKWCLRVSMCEPKLGLDPRYFDFFIDTITYIS